MWSLYGPAVILQTQYPQVDYLLQFAVSATITKQFFNKNIYNFLASMSYSIHSN